MIAPVRYVGMQPGYGPLPAMELYTLLAPVGSHPAGSTVSRVTLEKHGYTSLRVESAWMGESVRQNTPGTRAVFFGPTKSLRRQ